MDTKPENPTHVCRYCGENPDKPAPCCERENAERVADLINKTHDEASDWFD